MYTYVWVCIYVYIYIQSHLGILEYVQPVFTACVYFIVTLY